MSGKRSVLPVGLVLLALLTGLLMFGRPVALAQEPSFTHDPLPQGWEEGYYGMAPAEGSAYATRQIKEFNCFYGSHQYGKWWANAASSIGVYEVEYDELLRWLTAERTLLPTFWNLDNIQAQQPDMLITLREDSQSQTTLDGYPAVLLRRVVDSSSSNPEYEGMVTQNLLEVYWVDLGSTGVAIDVSMFVNEGHPTSLAQIAQETEAFIRTFRFQMTQPGAAVEPPRPPDDEPIPWIVVVGGLGVVAAGGAAVAAAATAVVVSQARKKAKSPQRKDKPQETAAYILQLSGNRLSLRPGEPATLQVTVWRVAGQGGYAVASEAQISLQPPPGVAVAPAQGLGQVACQVRQEDTGLSGEHILKVQAQAGRERHTGEVTLSLEADYRVEFF